MTTALLFVGLIGGFYAAWHGNVAAWALIASAALTSALHVAGVPFDFGLWLVIDLAVITAVERWEPGRRAHLIVVLMVTCWPLYQLLENGHAFAGAAIQLIVAMQFLLTVPWDRLGQLVWTEKMA